VSGNGTTVRSETIEMARGAGVLSDGGVVVMGTVGVTMLHPREMGIQSLPFHSRLCHPH
jgi:hypothetical protein